MKVHTFQKKPKKKWAHESSQHNPRICSFSMCETNIYRENLIRTEGKQVSRMNQESLQDPTWGRAPLVITISITILCF
jgi:hypothetical protein